MIERVYSGSDSGLSAIAEGAGMCRKSEGGSENEKEKWGSEKRRRSSNECGEGKPESDDD